MQVQPHIRSTGTEPDEILPLNVEWALFDGPIALVVVTSDDGDED